MSNNPMKTLKIKDDLYDVVDETARRGVADHETRITDLEENASVGELLWENPDTTVSFSQTDLSIDNITDYDFLLIIFKANTAQGILLSQLLPNTAGSALFERIISVEGEPVRIYRQMNLNTELYPYRILNCYRLPFDSSTTETVNGNMIPYQIIGFKHFVAES